MASDDAQPIVIAGAGIAGLATWRALKRQGIDSVLVERGSAWNDAGAAINLPGNAIAALTRLGLADEIERLGRPVRRREYRTHRDRLLATIDEDRFWGESMRPRAIRRSDLMSVLSSGVDPSAIRFGNAIASVEQDDRCVRAQLADGVTLSARLLVGADGVRSTVRPFVVDGVGTATARLASASWRFLAPNPGVDGWTVWTGEKGMILLLPVDDDTVYGWVAVTSPTLAGGGLSVFEEVFRDFPERVRTVVAHVLANPSSVHHSPIEEVRLPAWSRGRAILVGDAAHATAPVWAEGAALAMEDALALAELVARGGDDVSLGARFEARRRERVAHVQAMTDRLSKAARLPHGLRNVLMPFLAPRSYRATYEPLKRP